MFHPVIQKWFTEAFSGPTPAQEQAWPAIAANRDVLITAPTGSGKTLAAFLACPDRLLREEQKSPLGDETQVVYVSPLKALSNDIRRNLETPLAQISALAGEMGFAAPKLRAAVRTGDTPQSERQALFKKPPHILVTTPESLFILLTSEGGRRGLKGVKTVIVDEIHAMVADKRGAHLTLSLERLTDLVQRHGHGAPLQRIGLSATINPVEAAERLLVGGRPRPVVVDTTGKRKLDLHIELPDDELGAICTNAQWADIYDQVATLAQDHTSTLVFVNTRRLVERMALHLGERLGPEKVAAHHGSLSKERRFDAEQKLKSGDLKIVVATASLELGIDIGAVDLVCLVGSPRSISTALQRIGRASHQVGGVPKARFFPLTRDQLLECAALVRASRGTKLDRVFLREFPVDILAQQIVAACACEEWDETALFDLFRQAAGYTALTREAFDDVVFMLAEGIATRAGRSGARLHRDATTQSLRARRGARLAALTSGGAIPDTALFDVVLEPEGTLVGTLDEEFAIESSAGDIVQLGNNSWRIRRVETGKVRVEDAGGAPPNIPFWFGEGPGRTLELSEEVARLRQEIGDGLESNTAAVPQRSAEEIARNTNISLSGARLMRDYVDAGRKALGQVPSQTCVIAERFLDDSGGSQLIIHAPFGGRINRAWGMALRKRFCRSFDFELQAAATDDGVLLSLGPQHSFPLEDIFDFLGPDDLDEILAQAVLQAPMFETRFRWNAGRALAILRSRGGKKVPPHLLRMRAQDLLTTVFPQQTACQDNHGGGPIEVPDHPLVHETLRDCLTEPLDLEGLKRVIADLRAGRIKRIARDLPEPSVFAHEIINANPYAFLDEAPLEERRTRAVSLRRGLPDDMQGDLAVFDEDIARQIISTIRPDLRSADELHDLLLDLGVLFPAFGFGPLHEASDDQGVFPIALQRIAKPGSLCSMNSGKMAAP